MAATSDWGCPATPAAATDHWEQGKRLSLSLPLPYTVLYVNHNHTNLHILSTIAHHTPYTVVANMGVSPSRLIVIEVRAVVEHFIGHAVDGEGNEGEL